MLLSQNPERFQQEDGLAYAQGHAVFPHQGTELEQGAVGQIHGRLFVDVHDGRYFFVRKLLDVAQVEGCLLMWRQLCDGFQQVLGQCKIPVVLWKHLFEEVFVVRYLKRRSIQRIPLPLQSDKLVEQVVLQCFQQIGPYGDAFDADAGIVIEVDKEVVDAEGVQKARVLNEVFPEKDIDPFIDKYQLLCLKAVYNLKLTDLAKFSAGSTRPV